ncbi:MAG: phosphopantetheine-binding protein [Pseudomonadota bacterium]
MSVKDQVLAIIAQQAMLDPSEIKLDSSPEDIGMDSLCVVECIFAIEETFDISVPFNANDPTASGFDVSSVGAILAAVDHLKSTQGK